MTTRRLVCLLCGAFLLAFPALPVYAQASEVTYSNPDGSQSLAGVSAEGGFNLTYQEAGGYSAAFVLSEDGTLTVGQLALSAIETGVSGTQHTFGFTVNWRGQVASTTITVDAATAQVVGNPNLDAISSLISGQLSMDLDGNWVAESPEFAAVLKLNSFLNGEMAQNAGLKSWACWGNVLNGVAGGSAAALGCGGGCAGPWYRTCCGGAIAWYSSALIGIVQSC